MMTKIFIEPTSSDLQKPYLHLIPIAEALVDAGNKSVHKDIFFLDKDGWRCDLEKNIDFDLVKSRFLLPSSIFLSENDCSILCNNTWIEIKGG